VYREPGGYQHAMIDDTVPGFLTLKQYKIKINSVKYLKKYGFLNVYKSRISADFQ